MPSKLSPQSDPEKLTKCLNVLSAVLNQSPVEPELQALRAYAGPGWSLVASLQYLAGKKAKADIELLSQNEQPRALTFHWVARSIVSDFDLGAVQPPDDYDLQKIKASLEKAGR